MDRKQHWEKSYTDKALNQYSWYQTIPTLSVQLIEKSGVSPDAHIIDVGGGASTLADELLKRSFSNLTVLDISETALKRTQNRLQSQQTKIQWIIADITHFKTTQTFDLWHDRAVFHFLTDPQHRKLYKEKLHTYLKPGGHLILSTFALDGPERCSNLTIVRYSLHSMIAELGDGFTLLETHNETHKTPSGKEQQFIYGHFQRC